MKKIVFMLLAVIMASSVFVGCSKTSGDWDYLEKRGKIIVGFDPHFPPMGYYENNNETDPSKAIGFDIDVAKALGEVLNINIEFKAIDWSKKEAELKTKNIDLIWNGYTMNESRASQHLFSTPYMKNEQAVIIRYSDRENYTSLADLAGKNGVVQLNSSGQDVAGKHEILKNNSIIAVKDYGVAMTELETNKDFIVMDSVSAAYFIKKHPTKYYRMAGISLGDENYGIGIRQNASLTQYKINNALEALRLNGTLNSIAEEWFLLDSLLLRMYLA